MNTMPAIGSRVKYKATVCERVRCCAGIVVAHYPRHGEICHDFETGEDYVSPDHVGVRVDKPLPDWWAYPDTDRFAPDITDLEIE